MLSDPIAALATAPGRAGLAVVRLSGSGAFDIAARVIEGFTTAPPRSARLATFRGRDGFPVDRGLYLTFPAPHSYTGDDLVELSCHGGTLVPGLVLTALYSAGARPAAPGEFTRRAVLNGKLDLLQAEAVADLVDATATAQARSALRQLEGGLSKRLGDLRERLVELLALLAYEVDFPEEDDSPVGLDQVAALLSDTSRLVDALLATAPAGGRHPPGTTRDTIEATTEMEGWPVRLADTAGLWEAPGRLDRMGVEVSRRYLGAADLVLLCVEAGWDLEPEEQRILDERPAILVWTKEDLQHGAAEGPSSGSMNVSALTGAGLDRLRSAVAAQLFGAGQGGYADLEPMLTRERHRIALARAREALGAAAPHLLEGGDAVLAAHHVRQAVVAMDELVGAIDAETIFDRIFSRFCVGK